MQWLRNEGHRFLTETDGPTATEYAVMLALIIMVAIAGITLLGAKVNTVFTNADSVIPAGTAGSHGTTT